MTTKKRRSDRAARNKLSSPGRPGVASGEDRRLFWLAIAAGRSSEDAAVEVGVSQPVGSRWFRESGGMAPTHLSPSAPCISGRYLTFGEREEIALMRARGCGLREIAHLLKRSTSTISREVRRNAATRSGGFDYRARTAQWHAKRAARRPKLAKLAANQALRHYVRTRLAGLVTRSGHPVGWHWDRGPECFLERSATRAWVNRAGGRQPGAPSRYHDDCRSTFLGMTRCGSAMKPSIRPSSFKAAEHCAGT